jgi:acyl-coenzyme A thioesterase PaaI-like protein
MGPAVLIKTEGALYPSTIDMNISFLAAAKPGPLVCEGEVLRLGKSVGFVSGLLMDEGGRVLVRATSSVMLVPMERVGT